MADIEPDLHEADRRLFRLISDGATCRHVPGTGTDRLVTVVVHGDKKGFDWHWDEFRSGSGGGNCGLPGNEACNATHPASIPKAEPSLGPARPHRLLA